MSDPNAAPGWYPDVYDESRQRYWDGAAWTDHYHPVETAGAVTPAAAAQVAASPRPPASGRTTAIVLSIVGVLAVAAIVTTIVLVNRENQRQAAVADFCSSYALDSSAIIDAQYAYDNADAFVTEIVETQTLSTSTRDSVAQQLYSSAERVNQLYFVASHEFIPFEPDLGTLGEELTSEAQIIEGLQVGDNTFDIQQRWGSNFGYTDASYLDTEAAQLCGYFGGE